MDRIHLVDKFYWIIGDLLGSIDADVETTGYYNDIALALFLGVWCQREQVQCRWHTL